MDISKTKFSSAHGRFDQDRFMRKLRHLKFLRCLEQLIEREEKFTFAAMGEMMQVHPSEVYKLVQAFPMTAHLVHRYRRMILKKCC